MDYDIGIVRRRRIISPGESYFAVPVGSGPATYDGFAATRGQYPSSANALANVNTRSGHYARVDITRLKILVPNYYALNETATGAALSVTASVEYPAGTLTQILFSGSATGTVADGGYLVSDYLTLSTPILNAERFWIRLHMVSSAGIPYLSNIYTDHPSSMMGDCFEISATDRTMSGDIADQQNVSYRAIVIAPMTAPSVLIIGDSIPYGVTDLLDNTGDLGSIARTIGPSFGYFNAAMNGEAATDFIAHHTNRVSAKQFCTHVIVGGFPTNDIFNGDSAATIEGHLNTIYGYFSDKVVFQATTPPRTTDPIDAWTTTGNQTVLGTESVRTTLNADFRSTFVPPAPGSVFDVAAVVEAAAGKWIATAGIARTNDGVHPNNLGYLEIKASGAVNTALVGTPAAPATETGSTWLDVGTHLTKSTWRHTNDVVTHDNSGNSNTTARGAGSNSSGKKHFEIEIRTSETFGGGMSFIMGLINGTTAAGAGLDSYCGNIDDSFGIASAGGGYAFVAGTIFVATSAGAFVSETGNVFGLSVDFTNKFAYLHRNGVYFLSGDPTSGATGTGHVATWTGTPTLYPGVSLFQVNNSVKLRTSSFLFAPPSGYSAWG